MEVLRNAFQTLVDEMGYTLGRTCASQLVRDVQDFQTGLCDAEGNLIALSITQPGTLAMIPGVLAHVIPAHGSDLWPGDVIIVNDPYNGGTHLNDIHLVKPVFADGAVVGWLTSKAHHIDVGGKVPGSMSFDCSEIFQEGLRLPPVKLYQGGEPNDTIFKLLELNVRYPDVVFADLNAQLTALEIGEKALAELLAEFGAAQLQRYFAGLLDHGEALARAAISSWPDGSAEFEDYCDDDGVTGEPIVIHVKVTVKGDEVALDFAGTSDQVPAAVNFPNFEAVSYAWLAIRCCLGEVPNNSGTFRPISTSIPLGTILNPRPPAPSSERGLVTYRVGDAVFGALAQFVPEGVTAAGEGGSYLMRIGGTDDGGREFLCVDLVQGTWGARAERDGVDGLANLQANHTNTPVEAVEANFPVRVESHTLVPDTGGAGRYRGGLAIERSWRYLGAGRGSFRSRSDRCVYPPYGLFGGRSGLPSRLTLERGGAPPTEMASKATFDLQPGDLVTLRIAGGGGWGQPSERDPRLIAADIREGKISVASARAEYGWTDADAVPRPARAAAG